MQIGPLGQEGPLEEEMTPHSSILPWRIPWPGEPGGLQSTGLQRVGHKRLTHIYGEALWISQGKESSLSIVLINMQRSGLCGKVPLVPGTSFQ